MYSLILRVGSPYVHHPALSGLFLHLFRFTFSVPLPQALGSVLFPGPGKAVFRTRSIVCCAVLEVVWRKQQWGWQKRNWTFCRDSTKYSKVIRIRLEQVINESSMAVTGQSNIYRTSSISIAAAERKPWSPGAPRPARDTHADRLPQNLEACVDLLTCPGGARIVEVVIELKNCWDYAALCFRTNFSDVLGWINAWTYWWGDSCAKMMGKLSGGWGMYIGVYTLGKGTRFCNILEKQLLRVKCQKRLNHNRQETLRREQSGIGKPIFRITWHNLINILGGSYHMVRNRRIITSIPMCLLSGF